MRFFVGSKVENNSGTILRLRYNYECVALRICLRVDARNN